MSVDQAYELAKARYAAFGIVSANSVVVSAPLDGHVQFMHVREGDQVRQGQLLATLHNLEAEHRLERIADQLRPAQSNLSAAIAKQAKNFGDSCCLAGVFRLQ